MFSDTPLMQGTCPHHVMSYQGRDPVLQYLALFPTLTTALEVGSYAMAKL